MNESEFAEALIEQNAQSEWTAEVHYNHYGSRGCLDLFEREDNYQCNAYELKSQAALENVTGANEIVRQFNTHRKYLRDGSEKLSPRDTCYYYLLFETTEKTVNHIRDNRGVYRSCEDGDSTVGVWHKDIGIVPITNETVWSDGIRAEQIREVIA